MFDTIHTDDGCGQVKCFGRMLLDYRVGDAVVLHRSLSPSEHMEIYDRILVEHTAAISDGVALQMAMANDPRTNLLMAGEPTDEETYQVKMLDGGGFIKVHDNVIVSWDDTFDTGIPCFDRFGRPVAVIGIVGARVTLDRELCEDCAS